MTSHTVTQDEEGQRLDRLVKKLAPALPHGLIQKLVRTKGIRVNSHRAKADQRVEQGDIISWPDTITTQETAKATASVEDREAVKAMILFDDDDFLVLNKPNGLATQGGSKQTKSLDFMLGAVPNNQGVKPRLVHRLDKDTSGVLLTARSADMARRLTKMFAGRDMEKMYLAIVHPQPQREKAEIDAPLLKDTTPGHEKMVVDPKGDSAQTKFEVLARKKGYALVKFMPQTGRMHQIRIHAAHFGMPLLGDVKYGGSPHPYGTHLHAYQLGFKHPVTKYNLLFHADLPQGFIETCQQLGLAIPSSI